MNSQKLGGTTHANGKSHLSVDIVGDTIVDQSRIAAGAKQPERAAMNSIDVPIVTFLNQFAQQSWLADSTIQFCAGNTLLKGCLVVALLWWVWFQSGDDQPERRSRLVATLMACIVAVLMARGMALTLPHRHRPLHEPGLDFILPHNVIPGTLEGWSSFPSDHAVLFFGLATGIFLASRRVGLVALGYVCWVTGFARVYVGYHYPTDVLAGAAMGATAVYAANHVLIREKVTRPVMSWLDRHPSSFYAFLFLLTYQIADVFSSARDLGSAALNFLEKVIGS